LTLDQRRYQLGLEVHELLAGGRNALKEKGITNENLLITESYLCI